MAGEPVLVLQMQRMGDLILSFPLLLWLRRCYPAHPLHVVAEEAFYRPLLPVSPPAAYISWPEAATGALSGQRYRLIVNLSIREEAALLAGSLEADAYVGPVRRPDGALRVHGAWQVYRAGLVDNNRHNRFHWADLNVLDSIPFTATRTTNFAPPRTPEPENRNVGLFVGASEPGKRPDAVFYAALVRELLDRGLTPALLGGPGDRHVADEVRALFGQGLLDLVGRLTLAELVEYGRTLSLLLTPDTGPMHLAAWTGLPTLNLSVGHVNPWETGPYQPGHLVLRSSASCARGCWACTRKSHICRAAMSPKSVAALAAIAQRGPRERLERLRLPGLSLHATERTEEGLFFLRRLGAQLSGEAAPCADDLAGEFWRRFFLWRLSGEPEGPARDAWQDLSVAAPRLAATLRKGLPGLSRGVARLSAQGAHSRVLHREVQPFWRLFAGYLEMSGQNADASPQWLAASREHLEALASLL